MEFVIAVPLMLLVMFAVAEIGRALVQFDTLSYAVRSSARFVSEHAIAGTTGVIDISDVIRQQAQLLAVYGNTAGSGTPRLPGLVAGNIAVNQVGQHDIEVSAQFPYQPIIGAVLPSFGSGGGVPLSFTMRINVRMRAIS